MPITDQEVIQVLDELLSNLGLQLEEYDIVFLTQAEIYVEIFKVMFPSLAPMLDIDFDNDEVDDQELIQTLIDFLSKNIIRMDLDHISGERIVNGDKKNMLNFIQLLSEISKMVNGEEEVVFTEENKKTHPAQTEERINFSSPASLHQVSSNQSKGSSGADWKANKHHSIQGVPSEFIDQPEISHGEEEEEDLHAEEINNLLEQKGGRIEPRKEVQKEKYIQDQRRSNQSGQKSSFSEGRISEVSKSREISDYERTSKKDHQLDDYGLQEEHPEHYDQNQEYEENELITEEAEEYEQDEGHGHPTEEEYEVHGLQPTEEEEEEDQHQHQQEEENDHFKQHYYNNLKNQVHNVTENVVPQVSREAEDSNEIEYYSSDPVDYRQVHKSPEEQARTEESHKRYIHTVGEGTEEEEEDQDEEENYEQPTIPTHKKTIEATYHHESNRTQPSNAKVKFRHQNEETEDSKPRSTKRKSMKKSVQNAKSYAGGKVPYRPLKNTISSISNRSYDETQKRFTHESELKHSLSYEGPTLRAKPKKKTIPYSQPNPTEEVASDLNSTEDVAMKPRGDSYIQDKATTKKIKHKRGGQKGGFKKTEYQHELEKYTQERLMKQMEVTRKRRMVKKSSTTRTMVTRKGQTLKQIYDDNQEGIYDLLRGEKLNYVKKINKIRYQLENKKVEENQSMYISLKREQDLDEMNRLLSVKRSYQENLGQFNQAHLSQKGEVKQNNIAQKAFLKTLSKELVLDQLQEIDKLQNRWIYERTRFEILTQDTEYLERKVLELYRR